MTHRTTFALDDATVTRIRRLAAQWQVSQAEVIRRVVASTDAAANPDPVAMLEALHRAGGRADGGGGRDVPPRQSASIAGTGEAGDLS